MTRSSSTRPAAGASLTLASLGLKPNPSSAAAALYEDWAVRRKAIDALSAMDEVSHLAADLVVTLGVRLI